MPSMMNLKFYKFFFIYKFLSSSSNDVGRWNIFRWSIKFYWTKNIFVKTFLKKTSPSDVTCHVTSMYNVHVVVPTCVFWWFTWGVSKNPILGGVSKMVVFGGGPKKGHFWPPRGAQNFLHPPPGKPRQNIYYLDTRHPPGGGSVWGVVFGPPPGPSWPGVFWCHFCTPPPGCKNWDLDITGVAITKWTHHVL